MFRKLPVAISVVAIAATFFNVAQAQAPQAPAFTPTPGVHYQINLYPITKFRGRAIVITESDKDLTPQEVESVIVTRGVWELCNGKDFRPPCTTISETREGIPIAIITRSVRLIGDVGQVSEAPVARSGPDAPVTATPGGLFSGVGGIVGGTPTPPAPVRAPPTPVVAPKVEVGGVPGNNPNLAGRAVAFFAAPAQNGLRVSACPDAPGPTPSARCVQSAADGFCVASGFRDSGWRETEVIGDRSYLVNVLCKQTADNDGARDAGGGLRLPFF